MSRNNRKRCVDMSLAELEAIDRAENALRGREEAFSHGEPVAILLYWYRHPPSDDELLIIVRNMLERSCR